MEEKAAAPPWKPSVGTVFRRLAGARDSGRSPEASLPSPSSSGNGVATRISNLHGVKRKPFVARLTADIIQTFVRCNPEFKYSESLNPKIFLTNPSTPAHNDGLDNANWDLILYVNLELVNRTSNRRFIVKEMLGQGTFGQVVKCLDTETNDYVAVKVIKNQPAFYHQALVEVSLLRALNQTHDPDDQYNIVRMLDYLLFQNHLCIAFEMLGQNLGLKMKFVRAFSKQILDAMIVMRGARIIHCDLKPENILLTPSVTTDAAVKVIDFGSACLEGKTVYSYIQDFPYFLEHQNMMCSSVWGQPPDYMLREAKNSAKFFKHVGSIYHGNEMHDGLGSSYRLLTEEEIEVRESEKPKVVKWYFPQLKLDQLICSYPWKNSELTETEKAERVILVDFLKGLLKFDPNKRWSPLQASCHPFITGEPFTGPYEPIPETPKIPIGRAAAVEHNPGGGHWLAAGLSPQVGSVNRSLPPNNPYPPKIPYSYGSSYGSFGSHGSYVGNAGHASSYGSFGDGNAVNMYYSPLGPGFKQIESSPDIRLRPRFSHDRGIRLSPGSMGPMSLGASPSQFTPPNYQMQIPSNSTGMHGSGSPASGGIHGSPLGKTPSSYSKRRGLPPHEYPSQHGHGRHGDGVGFSRSDASVRGHPVYSQNSIPSPGYSSWRPQIGSGSSFSLEASSSHGPSQAFHSHFAPRLQTLDNLSDSSAPSTLDNAYWDPYFSDESLLHEDNSLSADLSSSLHLGDSANPTSGSARTANVQSHIFMGSNPLPAGERGDQLFHASSRGSLVGSTHSAVPINYGGYNPVNDPQQNPQIRHGQPFIQHRYNQASSTHNHPRGSHHNRQPAWPMADGTPWGGTSGHPFTSTGLPSSLPRKDYGSIF
uniref:Protein kinase domain-containing protein n=1 Tax=Oryza punctata TaxID=4537 RepID=A0A0E0KUS7_ORYPU